MKPNQYQDQEWAKTDEIVEIEKMDLVFLIFFNHLFAQFKNTELMRCTFFSQVLMKDLCNRPPSRSKCDKFRNWKMRISWILNQSLNSLKVLRRIPTSKSQCRKLGNLQTKSWKWNWILSCKNWRIATSTPKHNIQRNRYYRNTSSRSKHKICWIVKTRVKIPNQNIKFELPLQIPNSKSKY